MRSLILVFLVSFIFTYSFGQDSPAIPSKAGVAVFQGHYLQTNFDKFNTEATALGYAPMDNFLYEYGVVFGSQTAKQTSTFGLSWVPRLGQGNQKQVQYGHLLIETQNLYSFLKKNRSALGINLGLGLRFSKLSLIDREDAQSLPTALDLNYRLFKNTGVPIWAGLESNFLIGKKTGGFALGLGAGYRLDRVNRWKIEDAAKWKTKNVDLSGFYATVRLGFFGKNDFKYERGRRDTRNTSL